MYLKYIKKQNFSSETKLIPNFFQFDAISFLTS